MGITLASEDERKRFNRIAAYQIISLTRIVANPFIVPRTIRVEDMDVE